MQPRGYVMGQVVEGRVSRPSGSLVAGRGRPALHKIKERRQRRVVSEMCVEAQSFQKAVPKRSLFQCRISYKGCTNLGMSYWQNSENNGGLC